MKDISTALPYENPEKILKTMIAWGRYAGLMDYDTNTKNGDKARGGGSGGSAENRGRQLTAVIGAVRRRNIDYRRQLFSIRRRFLVMTALRQHRTSRVLTRP
jgi:hypothetical protein